MTGKIDHAITRSFEDQNTKMQQLQGGLREAVAKAADEQEQLIREITRNIDQSMQDELNRVIQLMANNLGAITGKFVEDYTQLTGHMEQVLRSNGRSLS